MYTTTINNAQDNLTNLFNMALKDDEIVTIAADSGNVVMISEAEYRGFIETLFIENNPRYKLELLEAMKEPESEYIDASEVGL